MSVPPLLNAAGRRRSPVTLPGYLAGRPPRNKGLRYPPDPPTVEEIVSVMRQAGNGVQGARMRALIVLLWRAVRISAHADDMFGRLAGAGIVCWFGFQAFQNIGMCLGIMPVTGVPLPFVSYGGSSMFATLLAVGLLQNIHLRSSVSPAARSAGS